MTRWARGEIPWLVSWDMAAGRWHVAGQRQILHIRLRISTSRGTLELQEPMYSFDDKGQGWFLPDDLYRTEADAAAEVETRQIQTFGPRAKMTAGAKMERRSSEDGAKPDTEQGNFLIRKMEEKQT